MYNKWLNAHCTCNCTTLSQYTFHSFSFISSDIACKVKNWRWRYIYTCTLYCTCTLCMYMWMIEPNFFEFRTFCIRVGLVWSNWNWWRRKDGACWLWCVVCTMQFVNTFYFYLHCNYISQCLQWHPFPQHHLPTISHLTKYPVRIYITFVCTCTVYICQMYTCTCTYIYITVHYVWLSVDLTTVTSFSPTARPTPSITTPFNKSECLDILNNSSFTMYM